MCRLASFANAQRKTIYMTRCDLFQRKFCCEVIINATSQTNISNFCNLNIASDCIAMRRRCQIQSRPISCRDLINYNFHCLPKSADSRSQRQQQQQQLKMLKFYWIVAKKCMPILCYFLKFKLTLKFVLEISRRMATNLPKQFSQPFHCSPIRLKCV